MYLSRCNVFADSPHLPKAQNCFAASLRSHLTYDDFWDKHRADYAVQIEFELNPS